MDLAKILAAAATALAVGGGVGGTLGTNHGYSQRDAEVADALERARCKIGELKSVAGACGWERPEDWCALREEQ